jgi:hypothetical protein
MEDFLYCFDETCKKAKEEANETQIW